VRVSAAPRWRQSARHDELLDGEQMFEYNWIDLCIVSAGTGARELAMTEGLSVRQKGILDFVQEFLKENGYPPTIREIGAAMGISSTSVVSYHLQKLEAFGHIARNPDISRGMRLTRTEVSHEPTGGVVHLPLLGRIVAGEPIPVPSSDFSLMGDDTIELTREVLGDTAGLYALEVEGNSMIDALVHDGDVVVMRQQHRVENGEMAAVWLKDREEVTLKRFYQEPTGRVRLQPANPSMHPLFIEDPDLVEVQGKVVMVIRQLD
jgi:repressor LexA